MRKNWKNKLVILGVFSWLLFLAGCGQKDTHSHAAGAVYTCPMHPQIVKDKPGNCPICGMDLVQKGGASRSSIVSNDTLYKDTANIDYLIRPTNATVISSVKTIHPHQEEISVDIQSPGIISYDTRRIYNIAARFGGRIEKLYIKYNYQPVKKGGKLYDIYSPSLITAQRELIYLLENDPANHALIGAARQKLSLLGVSANQIAAIESNKKADYTLSVYSPYNGYIVEERALPGTPSPTASAGSSPDGMGSLQTGSLPADAGMRETTAASVVANEISIREGMYVDQGQTLFKVVNTDVVWAVFRAYPEDIASLYVGQPVHISVEADSSRSVKGKVDFIEPFYSQGATLPGFRVYLPNHNHRLQIGNLLQGTIRLEKKGLWLPNAAVIDLGEKQIAFIKQGEAFVPVQVTTGIKTDKWTEIKSGVSEKDALAADAQFMIDSESFVKIKTNETSY